MILFFIFSEWLSALNHRCNLLNYAILSCLYTQDMDTFAGFLLSHSYGFGGRRNTQAFKHLYWRMQRNPEEIKLGLEKLRAILLGTVTLQIDGSCFDLPITILTDPSISSLQVWHAPSLC